MSDHTSNTIIGLSELAAVLDRPAATVRAAYAAGFIPLASQMRGGARCFDRADAELFGALLAAGDHA